jgi:hypothetical protein
VPPLRSTSPANAKGNKTCSYRFKIFGRVVEKVTDTTNPAVARRLGIATEARLRAAPPRASDEKNITFAEAADLYRETGRFCTLARDWGRSMRRVD